MLRRLQGVLLAEYSSGYYVATAVYLPSKDVQTISQTDPFFRQVVPRGDCYLWVGAITTQGYARYGRAWLAHRWAWYQLHGGPVPPRLKNECGRQSCVNPGHWTERRSTEATS